MLTNLTNTKFIIKDIDGKNIPVNDPLRQALIKDTQQKLKTQTETYQQIETRSVLDVGQEISGLAAEYRLTTDTNKRIEIRSKVNKIKGYRINDEEHCRKYLVGAGRHLTNVCKGIFP